MHFSRAATNSDEELVALWSILQLSRIGLMNMGRLAAPSKVYSIVSCTCCCRLLLLNVLAVQDFDANGLRRALALSLIVRQPFPGLGAACEDPFQM